MLTAVQQRGHCFSLLVVAALCAGCVSKSVYLKETQRADGLTAQVQSLQGKVATQQTDLEGLRTANTELLKTLEAKKGELNQRLTELTKQNQDLSQQLQDTQHAKDAEIAKLKGSYDELVNGLKSELQAGQVTITQLKGRLSVNMVDKILFNSGEAEVKPEGRQVLERVREVLKKLQDKDIRIEGYTDNVPISAALRSKYTTNWELSTTRATAVVRYLEDKSRIPQDRLIPPRYAQNRPIAGNDTPEGRQQNRRIDSVLVPSESSVSAPSIKSPTASSHP